MPLSYLEDPETWTRANKILTKLGKETTALSQKNKTQFAKFGNPPTFFKKKKQAKKIFYL